MIERDGRFTAIECKYAEVIDEPWLKGLQAFADTYGRESLQTLYVASRTSRTYPLSGGITAVPGSEIADYLE
jgi:hypothetical protein